MSRVRTGVRASSLVAVTVAATAVTMSSLHPQPQTVQVELVRGTPAVLGEMNRINARTWRGVQSGSTGDRSSNGLTGDVAAVRLDGYVVEVPGYQLARLTDPERGLFVLEKWVLDVDPHGNQYERYDGRTEHMTLAEFAPDLAAMLAIRPSDLTTTGTNPGQYGYGIPDGVVDNADLTYFVEEWTRAYGQTTPGSRTALPRLIAGSD